MVRNYKQGGLFLYLFRTLSSLCRLPVSLCDPLPSLTGTVLSLCCLPPPLTVRCPGALLNHERSELCYYLLSGVFIYNGRC